MGLLLKPTTKVKRMPGSNGAGTDITFWKDRNAGNTAWTDRSFIKRRNATNDGWIWEFSKPTAVLSGGGARTGSGASGSGTVSIDAYVTAGGVHSGNLSRKWKRSGTDNGFVIDDDTAVHPGWSKNFTGVANGSTSAGLSESWYCEVTDIDTGAVYQTDAITIGPLAWQNTTPAFSAHTNTYTSGSGTEYVPYGSSSLTLKVGGGGGGGGNGWGGVDPGGGGGGGSGDYETVTRAISPSDWGAPIYWTVGAGSTTTGGTSSTTGTVTAGSVALSAPGGARGTSGSGGGGTGGAGGAPNGVAGSAGGSGGAGAGGNGGVKAGAGTGGKGGNASGSQAGASGTNGQVEFDWT